MILLATLHLLCSARGDDAALPPPAPTPPAAEPVVPPPVELPPVGPAADPIAVEAAPEQVYLQALHAWKSRDFATTLDLCTKAVNQDPLLSEAWLLRSYAHLRLRQRERALASVRLARESDRADVRAAARGFEARLTQDYVRDSPSLWIGGGPLLELDYGELQPRVVLNVGVGVPLYTRFTARAEVRWTAFDPGELRVGGSKISALGAWTLPLGDGRWSVTPSAGPSLWIATGQYWEDGANPYLGLRADLDLDARLTPAFGIYLAVGTEVYPGQLAALEWLGQPFEARTGVRLWFWKI